MEDSTHVLLLLVFCVCGIQTVVSDEDGPCENGQIKLKNGYQGLLEVCVGNEWGPVCDLPEDPFTVLDQQVACFQLGYSGDGVNSNKSTCDHTAWTYGITCDGTEERLLDCAHPDVTNAPPRTCTKFENVYLTCPLESQIRLNPLTKTKNYYFEGVLEHYYNGTWNSICSGNNWTNVEYGIVCKQLGLTGGSHLPMPDHTPDIQHIPQNKYYVLTNVTCNGEEEMIKDCPHDPWHVVQGKCPYNRITVHCEGPELSVSVVNKTDNNVTLRWDIPPNMHKYYKVMSKFCVQPWEIDANNVSTGMMEHCVPQDNLSSIYVYTYCNLKPDTEYVFSVYGYMDEHRGPLNNETVTTETTHASKLTTLDIVGISGGAVVLAILLIIVAIIIIIATILLYRKYHDRGNPGGGGGGAQPLLRPDGQGDQGDESSEDGSGDDDDERPLLPHGAQGGSREEPSENGYESAHE